jgi:hypothetical protein
MPTNNQDGRTLDACQGTIVNSDSKTGRAPFDPAQAPANWDIAKRGTPDVVFMKWNGYPKGGEKGALGRAWDKTQKSWLPVTRAQ